jgi:hypothetical protein
MSTLPLLELGPEGNPARAPREERRSSPRTRCDPPPLIQLIVRPNFTSLRALVHDASDRGLGLLLHRPLPPGSVLALRLRQGAHGVSCILSARVVHATPHPQGGWLIGCRFSLSSTVTDCSKGQVGWALAATGFAGQAKLNLM